MNVKRLAAIDMYGTRGTVRRRRIIAAEFILGTVGAMAFGVWLTCVAAGLGNRFFGMWALGVGLNYAPLAAYAITLSRPGAIEAELDGTDTSRELRRYGLLQFWVAVPLALAGLAVRDILTNRTPRIATESVKADQDGTGPSPKAVGAE
jgi:hypothetical protein